MEDPRKIYVIIQMIQTLKTVIKTTSQQFRLSLMLNNTILLF